MVTEGVQEKLELDRMQIAGYKRQSWSLTRCKSFFHGDRCTGASVFLQK